MTDTRCPYGCRFLIQFPDARTPNEAMDQIRAMYGDGACKVCVIVAGSNPGVKSSTANFEDRVQSSGYTVYIPLAWRLA